jgi:uncharacterized protein (DUF2236 family)
MWPSYRIAARLAEPRVLLKPVHGFLRDAIIGVIATSENFGIDYDAPLGDAGLFGPDSVTWKIHADFPA